MIRRVAIALMVVVLGALAGQSFAGGAKKYPTRPTIKVERAHDHDVISGKLRSKSHECEANRKVKLRHRGVKDEAKASVIARPRTNGKGKWTFKPKSNQNGDRFATPGYYHVKAGEKRISTGDGEIVCKERESSSLYIG